MIEHEQQIDPCVSLELNASEVALTVSVRLRQGSAHWTPQEAGEWFARNWQEAQQALWVCMVHRIAAEPGTQLVRSGEEPWSVASQPAALVPSVVPEPEAEPAAPAAVPVPRSAAPRIPMPKTRRAAAVRTPSPASGGMSEADEARATVLSVLTKNEEPVSVADLKLLTELSDYRVRKALRELQATGSLQEERRDAGAGRWKETVLYRLKRD